MNHAEIAEHEATLREQASDFRTYLEAAAELIPGAELEAPGTWEYHHRYSGRILLPDIGPDARLWIKKDGKRVNVSGSWPVARWEGGKDALTKRSLRGNRREKFEQNGQDLDKAGNDISVAYERGPDALAQAINSRFLPGYKDVYLALVEVAEDIEKFHGERQRLTDELAGILGSEPPNHSPETIHVYSQGGVSYGDFQVSSEDHVNIKLSANGATARRIAQLIAEVRL